LVKRADAYKWVKVGGLLSLIPLALAAGPLAGYIAGEYLIGRFGLPAYTTAISVALGIVTSMVEVFRIIKAALLSAKN